MLGESRDETNINELEIIREETSDCVAIAQMFPPSIAQLLH